MMDEPVVSRRRLVQRSAVMAVAGLVGSPSAGQTRPAASDAACREPAHRPPFQLGLVTYNLAADWDLATIIARCRQLGLAAVELRTTHKHGVEPSLGPAERRDVRKRFEDGGIVLWGLGTVCEFHSPDAATVARNIELAGRFAALAADVGAKGIKVRPNALPKGTPEENTVRRIGEALRACGDAAASHGVEVWLEVHGAGSAHPPRIRRMLDAADHPNVGVTWNSNHPGDLRDGSVEPYFRLLQDKVRSVHINELTNPYPWAELFDLLARIDYRRYTLIEVQPLRSGDPADTIRFLQYYKGLWEQLARPGASTGPGPSEPPPKT